MGIRAHPSQVQEGEDVSVFHISPGDIIRRLIPHSYGTRLWHNHFNMQAHRLRVPGDAVFFVVAVVDHRYDHYNAGKENVGPDWNPSCWALYVISSCGLVGWFKITDNNVRKFEKVSSCHVSR